MHLEVLVARVLTDDHAPVDLGAGADEQLAPLLELPEGVAGGGPDPVGDQTTEKEKFIKVAVANCTAPKLSGFKYNDAQAEWTKAKFTGTVSKDTGAPNGNFVITAQSVVYTSVVPCSSNVKVSAP